MIRRAIQWLGWGFLAMALGVFIYEFVTAGYEMPPVGAIRWAMLVAVVAMLAFSRERDEVVEHHLPH